MLRLITPEVAGLDAGVRARVHEDVVAHVVTQIEQMPSILALPYRLALWAFGLLPVLRYGRTFLGLTPPRQAVYLSSWSNAVIAPARDFIKLIRSCALLAYFDHPQVCEALRSARGESLSRPAAALTSGDAA